MIFVSWCFALRPIPESDGDDAVEWRLPRSMTALGPQIDALCSQSLAGRTRDLLAGRRDIEEKRMSRRDRVPAEREHACRDLEGLRHRPPRGGRSGSARQEPDVGPFDITGKPMKNWVLVGPDGVDTDEQLRSWIDRADRFVRTLPAK